MVSSPEPSIPWYRCRGTGRIVLLRYLPAMAAANLAWEIVQLPLYAIWSERLGVIAYAVLHCTAGDVLIAASTLLLALTLSRSGAPATWRLRRLVLLTVALGLGYTIASERLNLLLGHWSYAPWMPVVPGLGVGLAPLLQWLVIPLAVLPRAVRSVTRAPGEI